MTQYCRRAIGRAPLPRVLGIARACSPDVVTRRAILLAAAALAMLVTVARVHADAITWDAHDDRPIAEPAVDEAATTSCATARGR
jgi:hypothetical protein